MYTQHTTKLYITQSLYSHIWHTLQSYRQQLVALWFTQSNAEFYLTLADMWIKKKCKQHNMHTHTCRPNVCMHTHTWKEEESVAAEGVTKHARSQPFGTICHHIVTKPAWVTKCVASASNLTRFVILATKCAVVTKQNVPQHWSLLRYRWGQEVSSLIV